MSKDGPAPVHPLFRAKLLDLLLTSQRFGTRWGVWVSSKIVSPSGLGVVDNRKSIPSWSMPCQPIASLATDCATPVYRAETLPGESKWSSKQVPNTLHSKSFIVLQGDKLPFLTGVPVATRISRKSHM
eukprot:5159303-Amphidinium_carterae.2